MLDYGIAELAGSVDALWLIVSAALVFFMQAGFAMVESGFTRAKNAGNIVMKNTLDFVFATIVYVAIGNTWNICTNWFKIPTFNG